MPALKVKAAEVLLVPVELNITNPEAEAVFPTQKGGLLNPPPEKVMEQAVAAPPQVMFPVLLVEAVLIVGVVPHVPAVGLVPLEIMLE